MFDARELKNGQSNTPKREPSVRVISLWKNFRAGPGKPLPAPMRQNLVGPISIILSRQVWVN
jgi:hypothetical protein